MFGKEVDPFFLQIISLDRGNDLFAPLDGLAAIY
jgi:hypothetical protein